MSVPIPRSLDDALMGGKSLMGDGAGLLQNNLLKRVALGSDAVIDAAVVNAGIPDDAANSAARKAKKHAAEQDIAPGGMNALFNVTNNARQQQQKTGLSFTGTEEVAAAPAGDQANVPSEPKLSGIDQVMNVAQTGLGYAGYGLVATEMVLPALSGITKKLGFEGAAKTLDAPKRWLNETRFSKNLTARQTLNDGIQIGFTALQTYGVAKGFNDNMAAMKEMYTDITGQEAPGTMAMLTGEVPPMLVEARSHFIKEYGTRGLIQVAGWGLMIRDLMRGKLKSPDKIEAGRIGMIAGILPGVIGMGVDMLMGTSATEVYSGFKKAVESGQPVGANEYAAFILASSPDLAKRRVGKQVALEIGGEYAGEKTMPGEILRQINDGRFAAKIEQLIAKDEAELAQKTQAQAPSKELTMVEKINGAKPQDRPKLGHFTGMVADKGTGLRPDGP